MHSERSQTSPMTGRLNSAEWKWRRIQEVFADVLESPDRDRLESEADMANLLGGECNLGWILRVAATWEPDKAFSIYEEVNPYLDLSQLNDLGPESPEQEYSVAAGLLLAFGGAEREAPATEEPTNEAKEPDQTSTKSPTRPKILAGPGFCSSLRAAVRVVAGEDGFVKPERWDSKRSAWVRDGVGMDDAVSARGLTGSELDDLDIPVDA